MVMAKQEKIEFTGSDSRSEIAGKTIEVLKKAQDYFRQLECLEGTKNIGKAMTYAHAEYGRAVYEGDQLSFDGVEVEPVIHVVDPVAEGLEDGEDVDPEEDEDFEDDDTD